MSEKTNQWKLEKEKENGLSCDATIYHSGTLSQSNLKKSRKNCNVTIQHDMSFFLLW